MRILLPIIISVLLLSSCSKTDFKQEFVGGLTDVPNFKDTFSLGEVLSLNMMATGRDGCSSLKGLEINESQVNSKNQIWISSRISSVGCECTQIFPSFNATLNHKCTTKGWNIIKFFNLSIEDSKVDSFFVN
jgi:hypothetical protein